jgi:hypothetical protein
MWARFYARSPESQAVLATSRPFALRARDPLQPTPEAVAALDALTEALEALGWRQTGEGRTWFGREFVRSAPVAHAQQGADERA